MSRQVLQSTSPPWLHTALPDSSEEEDLASSVRGFADSWVVAMLHGANMTTFAGLFNEFSNVLKFPAYFGRNFNALYDCLTDLAWLPAKGYTLLLSEVTLILSQEAPADFVAFLKLLQRACESWNRAEQTGEPWDRPAIAFHVVFQTSPTEAARLRLTLQEAGVGESQV